VEVRNTGWYVQDRHNELHRGTRAL
jgi:hypothetical protein